MRHVFVAVCAALLLVSSALADSNEVFDLTLVPAEPGAIVDKWKKVHGEYASEAKRLSECKTAIRTCTSAERRFIYLMSLAHTEKRGVLNREVNLSIAYTSDLLQYGEEDVWSSPVSTLTTGKGDCEDYAILKHFLFGEAGVPSADRRLIIVKETTRSTEVVHMLLAMREEGRWRLFDNRYLALIEDRDAKKMQPIFIFDEQGVYRPDFSINSTLKQ